MIKVQTLSSLQALTKCFTRPGRVNQQLGNKSCSGEVTHSNIISQTGNYQVIKR